MKNSNDLIQLGYHNKNLHKNNWVLYHERPYIFKSKSLQKADPVKLYQTIKQYENNKQNTEHYKEKLRYLQNQRDFGSYFQDKNREISGQNINTRKISQNNNKISKSKKIPKQQQNLEEKLYSTVKNALFNQQNQFTQLHPRRKSIFNMEQGYKELEGFDRSRKTNQNRPIKRKHRIFSSAPKKTFTNQNEKQKMNITRFPFNHENLQRTKGYSHFDHNRLTVNQNNLNNNKYGFSDNLLNNQFSSIAPSRVSIQTPLNRLVSQNLISTSQFPLEEEVSYMISKKLNPHIGYRQNPPKVIHHYHHYINPHDDFVPSPQQLSKMLSSLDGSRQYENQNTNNITLHQPNTLQAPLKHFSSTEYSANPFNSRPSYSSTTMNRFQHPRHHHSTYHQRINNLIRYHENQPSYQQQYQKDEPSSIQKRQSQFPNKYYQRINGNSGVKIKDYSKQRQNSLYQPIHIISNGKVNTYTNPQQIVRFSYGNTQNPRAYQ